MTEQHLSDDLLVDLALGDVRDDQRDLMTAHLSLCERCRSDYTATADAVEHLLPAAPHVAPPPGFSRSVLEAMGLASPDRLHGPEGTISDASRDLTAVPAGSPDLPRPTRPDRVAGGRGQHRTRRALLLGMAAVLVLLLAVSGAVLMSRSAQSDVAAAAGQSILTSSGEQVGQVTTGWYAGEPVLIISIEDAPVGKRYQCLLVLADGTRHPAGTWTIPESGSATWVVDRPSGDIDAMELVTPSGTTWATASL